MHKSKAVWFNRACAVGWTISLVPALVWWKDSIVFVIIASVYANIKSDWGVAEAADDQNVEQKIEALEDRLIRIEAMLNEDR